MSVNWELVISIFLGLLIYDIFQIAVDWLTYDDHDDDDDFDDYMEDF